MRIAGSCHCGNIAFTLDWRPEPDAIPARACTCSFCTRHGAVWTACPGGSLSIAIADAARVSPYAFGTRTAQFHVCAQCGVVPAATSDIDGRRYAVVNVRTFSDLDLALLRIARVTHTDADEAARLARRQRSWIADVTGGLPAS